MVTGLRQGSRQVDGRGGLAVTDRRAGHRHQPEPGGLETRLQAGAEGAVLLGLEGGRRDEAQLHLASASRRSGRDRRGGWPGPRARPRRGRQRSAAPGGSSTTPRRGRRRGSAVRRRRRAAARRTRAPRACSRLPGRRPSLRGYPRHTRGRSSTRAIHAGRRPGHGPVATPIYATSVWALGSAKEGEDFAAATAPPEYYTRWGNPTVRLLEDNLAHCGIETGFTIQRGDVADALRRLAGAIEFDVIVLDPPYEAEDIEQTLAAAASRLAPGGVLVLERATRRQPDIPASLLHMRNVRSGDSTLTFLERRI